MVECITAKFSRPRRSETPVTDSAIEACYRCRPFRNVGAPVKQHIQYATSSDGVRIAYAAMGQGTPVVRASHWLTHLEYELDSPVWRHLILGMASRHKFIRYDGRGTGLSQRDAVDISMDRWVSDLECIVDSLSLERFILLGVPQGGAISIEYAARHPDRVSHLIIHGAYARGFRHRENPDKQRQFVFARAGAASTTPIGSGSPRNSSQKAWPSNRAGSTTWSGSPRRRK